jgi:hypothetical protein
MFDMFLGFEVHTEETIRAGRAELHRFKILIAVWAIWHS